MRKLTMLLIVLFVLLATQAAQAEKSVIPAKLASQARWVAQHGGIYGSCYGCASSTMKSLVEKLIYHRFKARGMYVVNKMACISRRESGDNPGAVNSQSGAAGLFQFLGHPQYNTWLMLHDPVYAVNSAWSLSSRATDFSPWYGGTYNC